MTVLALTALLFPYLGMALPKTRLVLLGTGTPRLDPNRFGSSSAVICHDSAYLVDCGAGIVRRTAAARAKGIDALAPANLKTLFVTHLHSDHTVGFPDLILSPWVVGRDQPLEAYGPAGLQSMTDNLLAAYKEDIEIRVDGLEHGNHNGYKVEVHEIRPGLIYQDANVSVTAFPVKHGSWKQAFGYKFQSVDRTIVFSGDTAPCDTLVEAAKGADILVHEVYDHDEYARENRAGGEDWQRYMRSFHTSAKELGQIAAKCQVKLLVLVHVLRRHATDEQLIAEVRSGGFHGRIVVGKDLDVY